MAIQFPIDFRQSLWHHGQGQDQQRTVLEIDLIAPQVLRLHRLVWISQQGMDVLGPNDGVNRCRGCLFDIRKVSLILDDSVQDRKQVVGRDFAAVRQRQRAFRQLPGLVDWSNHPHASIDFNHNPHSAIIDTSQTRLNGSRLANVFIWFDNEWGFANRLLDTLRYWATRL